MANNKKKQDYNIEYNATHIKQIKFGFSLEHDADILGKLDSVPNKQGYIKALIRADIANSAQNKEEQTMAKWYIIDDCTGSKGQIFDEAISANSQAEALRIARAEWLALSDHDRAKRDDFYIGYAMTDEDGCIDYNTMTDIYSIKNEEE